MNTYTAKQYEDAVSNLALAKRAAYAAAKAVKLVDQREPEGSMEFTVVRGRKFPHGMTAKAEAIGNGEFGPWVRFTNEGRTQFISLRNVDWPAMTIAREAAYADANDAEEALRAARKVIVEMAGLDLTKPKEASGKLSQHSWSDSYVADYDCNPDAPDDVLRAALEVLDPPASSWGRLRWSQGSSLTARNGGTATITSHTGICD